MKIIANILAVYFLLGSFFPKTDFSQMLHLKDMVVHYDFHNDAATLLGNAYTITEFVYDHFVNPDEHQDSQEHQKLPFHTTINSIVLASNKIELSLETLPIFLHFHTSDFTNPFHLNGFLDAITYPPTTI